jgi:hypothetical protein
MACPVLVGVVASAAGFREKVMISEGVVVVGGG